MRRVICKANVKDKGKGKDKNKFHPRKDHESPEGFRGIAVLFL
jgi:hypothetical protein